MSDAGTNENNVDPEFDNKDDIDRSLTSFNTNLTGRNPGEKQSDGSNDPDSTPYPGEINQLSINTPGGDAEPNGTNLTVNEPKSTPVSDKVNEMKKKAKRRSLLGPSNSIYRRSIFGS